MQHSTQTDFELTDTIESESLACEVQVWKHKATQATHIHINPKADATGELAFSANFRTIPKDSTGVAHILEHTVLCGSDKYPVKSPFFKMTARSCATFMNAMTGADYTMYPFSTCNVKDFDNLLDLYLDSVFHSKIDKLDFLQEGWRHEIVQDASGKEELVYKGVVLNEMKGAFNSEVMQTYYSLVPKIFPTTTYANIAGGDPMNITDLSYEQLKEFYQTHYHPSNCVFFSYGQKALPMVHDKISQSLQGFVAQPLLIDKTTYIEPEESASAREIKIEHFSPNPSELGENKLIFSWLGPDRLDLLQSMHLMVFEQALMSAQSPLIKYIESCNLQLGDLLGFVGHTRQSAFLLELKNLKNAQLDFVKEQIQDVIFNIKDSDFDTQSLLSYLRDARLRLTEQRARSMPYAISLFDELSMSALANEDLSKNLNIDVYFNQLEQEIKSGGFIKNVLNKYINSSRCTQTISVANPQLWQNQQEIVSQRLNQEFSKMDEKQKHSIRKQTKMLGLKQNQDALEDQKAMQLLPKLTIDDIDTQVSTKFLREAKPLAQAMFGYDYELPVSYLSIYLQIPSQEQVSSLFGDSIKAQLVQTCWSKLVMKSGWADNSPDKAEVLRQRFMSSASLSSNMHKVFTDKSDSNKSDVIKTYCLSAKCASKDAHKMSADLLNCFFQANFNYEDKVAAALIETRQEILDYNSVASEYIGHLSQASTKAYNYQAAQTMHPKNLGFAKQLIEMVLDSKQEIGSLVEDIKKYHDFVIKFNDEKIKSFLISPATTHQAVAQAWQSELDGAQVRPAQVQSIEQFSHIYQGSDSAQLKEIQQQINDKTHTAQESGVCVFGPTNSCYNYYNINTGELSLKEKAALDVLCKILTDDIFHVQLREKAGAYGAGIKRLPELLQVKTYRDPNALATFNSIKESLALVPGVINSIDQERLDSQVISLVGSINSIKDRFSQYQKSFSAQVSNSLSFQQENLDAFLNLKVQDLKDVWSKVSSGNVQMFSYASAEQAQKLKNTEGWQIVDIVQDINLQTPGIKNTV